MASLRRQKVMDNYLDPRVFFKARQDGKRREQFQPEEGPAYQKLRPDMIYALLDRSLKTPSSAREPTVSSPRRTTVISARDLLERMSNKVWTCRATAHEGGIGDANRKADPYTHFTIELDSSSPDTFHVRCHELKKGGLLVFQVTY